MRAAFNVRQWQAAVLRSTTLTPAVKVLLVVMADYVNFNGDISVPRPRLAEEAGCSERQVSERLEQAVEARYLDRIARGQKHRTAVYRALRQPVLSERQNRPLKDSQRAVSPDTEMTAKPPAENQGLSVSVHSQRAVEPRASSKQKRNLRGLPAVCGSTSSQEQGEAHAYPRAVGDSGSRRG